MTKLFSSTGIDIYQKDLQQILIRGDGKEKFNQILKDKISILPPEKNLELVKNEKFIFTKNSFDQWSLLFQFVEDYKKIIKLVSELNSNDEILASDYSYGQVYFEVSGKNKNEFLNKLSQFDLRLKKFPINTMAQTLVARIDCSIYNLKDKYLITCNKSFEEYFKNRLEDTIKL
ncbi:MAG: sarcosine oxidase subunit gamma family protein [Pelagibacteraceae bacterium]|jgi:heterotetrameric sarcosine oxidase gamma subunit|tara:strand:+ start:96 stop:617 length:522 start_codon:yes stop_codon:yes gene_type:complete